MLPPLKAETEIRKNLVTHWQQANSSWGLSRMTSFLPFLQVFSLGHARGIVNFWADAQRAGAEGSWSLTCTLELVRACGTRTSIDLCFLCLFNFWKSLLPFFFFFWEALKEIDKYIWITCAFLFLKVHPVCYKNVYKLPVSPHKEIDLMQEFPASWGIMKSYVFHCGRAAIPLSTGEAPFQNGAVLACNRRAKFESRIAP